MTEDGTKLTCSEKGNGKEVIRVTELSPGTLLVKSSCSSHVKALFRCVTLHHAAGDARVNLYVIVLYVSLQLVQWF